MACFTLYGVFYHVWCVTISNVFYNVWHVLQGPSWDGRSGVHTHMTNTRITDPEILERRYTVVCCLYKFTVVIRLRQFGACHPLRCFSKITFK